MWVPASNGYPFFYVLNLRLDARAVAFLEIINSAANRVVIPVGKPFLT
jgi:hypothetical protein